MTNQGHGQSIDLLITVKAYPALGRRVGEAVCVAGVRTDTGVPEWVRLFPVPFRDLPYGVQFRKYDIVRLNVRPSADTRPESLDPEIGTLEVIDHLDAGGIWPDRRAVLDVLPVTTTCDLNRQDPIDTTLAWIRPREVTDFVIEERDPDRDPTYARQLLTQAQGRLFGDQLEVIPFTFRYEYTCEAPACGGHRQSIIDWETSQMWRTLRDRPNWRDLMRQKWLTEVCAPDRDVRFFMGNQHQHPRSFLILGVWWPRLP